MLFARDDDEFPIRCRFCHYEFYENVNAGGTLRQLAGATVQQRWRKQEGPRYRGPSCLRRVSLEAKGLEAGQPWRGVRDAWSERA